MDKQNAKKIQQCLHNRYMNMGKRIPGFDAVVVAYVISVLLFQILFQISPVMKFITKTPLYNIQTYLGVFGGVLIAIDFFTNKVMWRGKFCWLLYGILIFAGMASLRTIDYGLKENIFKLCWAAIQFALVYSLAHRMDKAYFVRCMLVVYSILLSVWIVACCISLYQYVHQIQYWDLVNPLAKDASYTRQGFFDNRLFGIFYTLNHAAFISLLFCLIGIFVFLCTKRITVKVIIIVSELILLCHILLSGSRSAFVALVACCFCIMLGYLYSYGTKTGWKKLVVAFTAAALVTVVVGVGSMWLKDGLAKVPSLYAQMNSSVPEIMDPTEQKVEENILDRDYLEADLSNGRFEIWRDYVSIYKDVGIIGLSPGNYMSYIYDNYPDLYIVDYIRQYYPAKYQYGFIYHVHSGYLMVYVSAGIAGILLLSAFVILCLIHIGKWLIHAKRLSLLWICSFSIVLAVAISAFFDEGIFFQNNPQTTVFWIALGILIKESTANKHQAE